MTAEELRDRRLRLGVTQQQLANALGVTRRTVNKWENGDAPVRESTALAIRHLLEQHEAAE